MAASTAVTLEETPRRADPSTRMAQVAALTGLRGFAAIMVVAVHVSGRTEYPWIGLPTYGSVSLFVLSGYLLYRPWARWSLQVGERPSIRVFARRRVARIFPAYLLVLVAVAVFYPPSRPGNLGGWVRPATLTTIYEWGQLPATFTQTWSLATELSWYFALPVMAGITATVARSRSPRSGFWISAAMIGLAFPITIAWWWWVAVQDVAYAAPHSLWLPSYLACFAGGALVMHIAEGERAGLVSLHRVRLLAADPWALPILALAAALLGTSALGGPPGFPDTAVQQDVRVACAAVVAVALLAIVVMGPSDSPVSRLLGARWFVAIGRWSYGIFLWHYPLIVVLAGDITYPPGVGGLVVRLLVVLGLSIPLGAATYAWVERPAIRWSQRPAGSAPPSASSSTSTQATAPTPTLSRREAPAE